MFGLFTGSGSVFDWKTTTIMIIESIATYLAIIIAIGSLSAKSLNHGFDID